MQRSRRRLRAVPSGLSARSARRFKSPSGEGRTAKKVAKRSPPSEIVAPPPRRQRQAEIQATVLARVEDFPRVLAALEVRGLRPFLLRAVPVRRDWERRLLLEGRAAQRFTKPPLCLESVHGAVASVSLASQCSHSHHKVMYPPTVLSTLPKHAQSWLHSQTGSAEHVDKRKSSARILERRQEKRNTSRCSSAAT